MISVCIATYNGEKYVERQLRSILSQIALTDEVIVCDDGSSDETVAAILNCNDQRVRIHQNRERLGHVKNFEKALTLAGGEHIFLSDQDDIWLPGRVETMMRCGEHDEAILLVASNFDLIDKNDSFIGEFRKLGTVRKLRIIQILDIFMGNSPYFGCTFMLRKSLLRYCLPFPGNIESHDIWIALVASYFGRVVNIIDPTLQHRIHGNNLTTTKRRALVRIFKSRVIFLLALVVRVIRNKFGTINR